MDLEKNPYMQVLYQVGSIFIKNSYNLDAETIRGKTVVDAGANIGLFSFLAAAMGAKRVYAFEPVDGTYRLLCKNISENRLEGIVVPVQKALGKETGTATIWYDSAGDLTAEIGQCRNKKRSSTIELVSVDSHLAGDELSFLKIDSEGFEKEILLGTKESIGRWKPVLSFSAYHKPEDKDELPRLVKSIRKDYDVKTINFGEDNIYAC
jgi:FkbM family methyltransferase